MKQLFEDLKVWQKGMELVKQVYQVTQDFPRDEMFGMTSQIRRAAVSVPVNIAEGKGRYHTKEYIQFLYTARGSIFEVMTLVKIGQELQYIKQIQSEEIQQICSEIIAMLNGLIQKIK